MAQRARQQEWEWKVEALAGYGDDPDIIDVSFFGDFRSANLAAQEQRPARVGLVKAGSPETVFYIRHGKLDPEAPARFRREVEGDVR